MAQSPGGLGKLKRKIMSRFGEEARMTEVDDVLVVHLDKPDESEIGRRIQEVREGLVLEDDCPLCRDLASQTPEVVIYDEDSVLYLGQNQVGSFASGHPRGKVSNKSPYCGRKNPAKANQNGEEHVL